MASSLVRIGEFDEEKENWVSYMERLEAFFIANQVPDDRKVPVVLTVMGPKTYAILKSLVAPEQPSDRSFAQIRKTLKDHFSPKPLLIAERYRFHCRKQGSTESITQYTAALRKLAETCEFNDFLHQALQINPRLT